MNKIEAKNIDNFYKLLRASMRVQKKVHVWDLAKNNLLVFELKTKEISRTSGEIFLVPGDKNVDWNLVSQFIKGSGLLNFFIPDVGLLFRSELKALEKDFIIVGKPLSWSIEDRRDSERFISLVSSRLQIEINRKKRVFEIFDISPNGLSIVLSSADSYNLKEGQVIERALIQSCQREFWVDLQVINTNFVTPYQFEAIPFTGKRYGMKFLSEVIGIRDLFRVYEDTMKKIKTA